MTTTDLGALKTRLATINAEIERLNNRLFEACFYKSEDADRLSDVVTALEAEAEEIVNAISVIEAEDKMYSDIESLLDCRREVSL